MISFPNDPLFKYQWFLDNSGQSGGGVGSDINVLSVWPDYTGAGIRVAIVDDGVQLDHPDLAGNSDLDASWDAVTNEQGGGPTAPYQKHGTPVAGLVAELANNGIGGSGVAPDATLISYRIGLAGEPGSEAAPTLALQKALASQADIVNNSWGSFEAFGNDAHSDAQKDFFKALNTLVTDGRDGKGSIVLFGNGNDGAKQYDSNLNNVLNNRHTIAVAALDDTGVRSAYSSPGANLLVSAPGGASTGQQSDRPGNGVLTTDRTGSDGYNTLPGEKGNYDYNFSGTSAATPIVSGVVALMLDANPTLGYRDVQEILAHSARFVDPADVWWTTTNTGTWNGGGSLFSRQYGFGEVDAHAAVRLAEVYTYLHGAPRSDANVKDVTASTGPLSITATPSSPAIFTITLPDGLDLNHLDLALDASWLNPVEMSVYLTSPSGTQLALLYQPQNALRIETIPTPKIEALPWPAHGFTMGTNAFWGETSGGVWQVQILAAEKGGGGTITGATLTGYGDTHSTEKKFVYTDDFASVILADSWRQDPPSRRVLKVAAGETAVIDAAAVSSDVTVNLAEHRATITGETIAIDAGATVTTVFTGDGNDSLVGDGRDNSLLAGRGSNMLDGGGGVDTALYIGSRAGYLATYSEAGTLTVEAISEASSDTAVRMEKATFAEGTLYVQAASDTGLGIAGLYDGLLFRDADGGGYRYWTIEAARGASLSSIGESFLASTEYAAGAGKLGDATFIAEVYQHLLGREADAGGAAYWQAELASGALDRAEVVMSICHSQEYDTTQLVGVFEAIAALGDLWS